MRKKGKTEASTAGVTPAGASELSIAVQTPTPRGMSIPCIAWGGPGNGKTSFIEGLARANFPVYVLIASIHDPTDFSGLPIQDTDRARYIPPEWALTFDAAQEGILFLDELSTAPPTVQAAALRVIQERRVGNKALPAGVRIVAAANPPDEAAGGWELSPPLANRFVHIDWSLSGKAYATALTDGFARPTLPVINAGAHAERLPMLQSTVAAFLRLKPDLVNTKPADNEYAFATPRTWDFAIRLLTSCDLLDLAPKAGSSGSKIAQNLLLGCVGSGAGAAFLGFMKNLNFPNPAKVLDCTDHVDVAKLKDDDLFVLFASLGRILLERKDGDATVFCNSIMVFLSLVDEVRTLGRLDAIFTAVRQVVGEQLLQKAIMTAHQQRRSHELDQLLKRVFEDETLAAYVDLVDEKGGR